MSYSLWTFVTLVGIRSASLKLLDEMLSYTFHSTSFIILAFYNSFLFINTAHPNTLVVNMFCLTQKLTDEHMKKIDSIYKQKEKVTSFWLNWWRNTKFSSVLIVWHIICLYFDYFRSCWRFNDCLHTNVNGELSSESQNALFIFWFAHRMAFFDTNGRHGWIFCYEMKCGN